MLTSSTQADEIEEELKELEQNLTRLRVSYDQYFVGVLRREPQDLRAKVQRTITRFVNQAPRNAGQKFRFNQLNAKFQAFRQLWGRTLREIEMGTYRPHRFRASLREPRPAAPPVQEKEPEAKSANADIERLARALGAARRKTGEEEKVSTRKLARLVRKQTRDLRKKYGKDSRIRFKVTIEDNRAKLKATLARD
jgi:hypothetical protein